MMEAIIKIVKEKPDEKVGFTFNPGRDKQLQHRFLRSWLFRNGPPASHWYHAILKNIM